MQEKVFKINVRLEFSAAHHIRGYDGECARPHGHNFIVEAKAETAVLDSLGIAIDFKIFKKFLKELIGKLDHQDLNLIPPFDRINPTAESLAKFLYEELTLRTADSADCKNLSLHSVTVWENQSSAASYGL